jgi:hypothetical protein
MISGLLDLDATAVLAASEDAEAELREREVDVLRLALQWADIHSTEPVDGGVAGGDRLVRYGGEGTPPRPSSCSATPPQRSRSSTPPTTLYVFLSDLVLGGRIDGVARVEGIGPMLLEQLAELLKDRDITLQPVIDLNHTHAVNGYEHPTLVKHRTLLRMLGDVFPHSANAGYRRLDHDHPRPYVPVEKGGPPGQTGDHADAPLTRSHHRAKTHQPGYQVDRLALGAYRWVTPHGLARMVTRRGTARVKLIRGPDGDIVGEVYDGPRIDYHPRQ